MAEASPPTMCVANILAFRRIPERFKYPPVRQQAEEESQRARKNEDYPEVYIMHSMDTIQLVDGNYLANFADIYD